MICFACRAFDPMYLMRRFLSVAKRTPHPYKKGEARLGSCLTGGLTVCSVVSGPLPPYLPSNGFEIKCFDVFCVTLGKEAIPK